MPEYSFKHGIDDRLVYAPEGFEHGAKVYECTVVAVQRKAQVERYCIAWGSGCEAWVPPEQLATFEEIKELERERRDDSERPAETAT